MSTSPDLSSELSHRIDALAARMKTSRADIIRDALENGRSLEWQEEWHRRVREGMEAAAAGDFASNAEVNAVFDRYRR